MNRLTTVVFAALIASCVPQPDTQNIKPPSPPGKPSPTPTATPSPSPSPSATPSPTATPTPLPSATPTPSATPSPTPNPQVSFAVGVPPTITQFKNYKTTTGAGFIYDTVNNVVKVRTDGVVLDSYDFRGTAISVEANNVTIKNSKFDAVAGFYTIRQIDPKSGLTVDHCTFDNTAKVNRTLQMYISGGNGKTTVTYNEFLNAPSDSVHIAWGVIDHNYFHGAGFATDAHADSIGVEKGYGPIEITNNFVDVRPTPGAQTNSTSSIAISNYYADVPSLIVSGNTFLGGAYVIYCQDFGVYKYGTLRIENNFIGAGQFGELYPNRRPAQLVYQNMKSTYTAPISDKLEGWAPVIR